MKNVHCKGKLIMRINMRGKNCEKYKLYLSKISNNETFIVKSKIY